MCLYPRLIKNRKYLANKKNQGNIPIPKDKRVLWVPVGCQKCIECKKQKARAWSVRLQEEIRHTPPGQKEFVTLTFSNQAIKKLIEEIKGIEGYELDNEIATLAVRRFLERWRKKYKVSIKHWLVTELGQSTNSRHQGTENIHLHGIIFLNKYQHNTPGIKEQYLQQQKQDIKTIWQYGHVYLGDYVNEKTVNYIAKYITKVDFKHREYNAKILTSPGIGSGYLNRPDAKLNNFKEGKTDETYKTRQGVKLNLPIYYRNKIYTEDEREKLWLEKLDKEERWVCGQRVSTKGNNLDNYYKLLRSNRALNRTLGYGDNNKNWTRLQYENERRRLLTNKRVGKCLIDTDTGEILEDS